ncbi:MULTISPECIES: helix-turn-helix transcriptional regulator [unclassified Massilia]|uniref:AraC family transcriptional regulator n=1 Tax=unclassified Massilia TaxID=2609279 RepID=UPI001784559F|nr:MULTISPECIES: helix-turn-helix transcriptional regulator [unclassified Massilia]MBD8529665.1 helix-turn-helix transcriptional regulator [Massilia sp. CFBP 13647]MBD8673248.1 helix-turn-helix transcriptional regulator [Massilia sp. CFBP 13721]
MASHPSHKHQLFDNLPRPLVVMENRWPAGSATGWHSHPKGQLLYATAGVMAVHTEAGAWVVTPNRALWMTTGLRHNVTMSGEVVLRTAYIDVARVAALPAESCVINISPLLRELLIEAARISPVVEPAGRDARLIALLIDEIRLAVALPLHLPLPQDERLRSMCAALNARPAASASAAAWAASIGVAERTLHRLFVRETGMTFAKWREQARLLYALQRIGNGDKVIEVALDCGYASPSAFAAMFKRHFGVTPSSFYR